MLHVPSDHIWRPDIVLYNKWVHQLRFISDFHYYRCRLIFWYNIYIYIYIYIHIVVVQHATVRERESERERERKRERHEMEGASTAFHTVCVSMRDANIETRFLFTVSRNDFNQAPSRHLLPFRIDWNDHDSCIIHGCLRSLRSRRTRFCFFAQIQIWCHD